MNQKNMQNTQNKHSGQNGQNGYSKNAGDYSMRRIRHVHLVGIGGAGMGGIAEVLLNLGYTVTGSDPSHNAMTEHLKAVGIKLWHQHHADNIKDCDVVVVSSAVAEDNVEIIAAREKRIPIVQRAAMLA